ERADTDADAGVGGKLLVSAAVRDGVARARAPRVDERDPAERAQVRVEADRPADATAERKACIELRLHDGRAVAAVGAVELARTCDEDAGERAAVEGERAVARQ